jgi:hypothetical protein
MPSVTMRIIPSLVLNRNAALELIVLLRKELMQPATSHRRGRYDSTRRPRGFSVIFLKRLKSIDTIDYIMLFGMLLLPFQVVQLSVLQPGHIWMLGALVALIIQRKIVISTTEVLAYLVCVSAAFAITLLQDVDRIKTGEQLLKFMLVYPGFYVVGRWLGSRYSSRELPFGYVFLLAFLVFELLVQTFQFPVIYQEIDFGQGSLHGTFKERNWLSFYFFLASYFLLMQKKGELRFIPFFLLNGIVTVLTANKTAIIACGVVFLIRSRVPVFIKAAAVAAGAILYLTVLGDQLTEDQLAVKLEEERGLAFQVSVELIAQNPIGYGFGFVESYFTNNSLVVKGLGEGTNSVFAVPLDMVIVAGIFGFVFWLVFFCGVGLGIQTILTLLPIALLSLLNPLHQSEMFYFFIACFVSLCLKSQKRGRLSPRMKKFGRSTKDERSDFGGRRFI